MTHAEKEGVNNVTFERLIGLHLGGGKQSTSILVAYLHTAVAKQKKKHGALRTVGLLLSFTDLNFFSRKRVSRKKSMWSKRTK